MAGEKVMGVAERMKVAAERVMVAGDRVMVAGDRVMVAGDRVMEVAVRLKVAEVAAENLAEAKDMVDDENGRRRTWGWWRRTCCDSG